MSGGHWSMMPWRWEELGDQVSDVAALVRMVHESADRGRTGDDCERCSMARVWYLVGLIFDRVCGGGGPNVEVQTAHNIRWSIACAACDRPDLAAHRYSLDEFRFAKPSSEEG